MILSAVITSCIVLSITASPSFGPTTVSVVEAIDLSAADEKYHSLLRKAAEQAATENGWEVLPGSSSRGSDCTSEECLAQVGKATGADYVLLLDGAFTHNNYVFEVRLYKPGTGWTSPPQARPADCPLCSLPDMVKHVKTWASEAIASQQRRDAVAKTPPPPVLPIKKVEDETPSSWRTPTTIGLLVAGGVLVALGVIELSKSSQTGCTTSGLDCDSTRNRTGGWAATGIGAALIAGGAFVGLGGRF